MNVKERLISRVVSGDVPAAKLLILWEIISGKRDVKHPETPELMQCRAAACYVGFSPAKMRALSASGEIPWCRMPGGNGRWYRRKELDNWMRELPKNRGKEAR